MSTIVGWLNTAAFTSFGAPTTWAEVLGFLAGAACVYLVAKQHIANWPLGIANNLLWILLFANAGLFADSALQVVFIGLALWGWWQWLHGGDPPHPAGRHRHQSPASGPAWPPPASSARPS